MKLSELDELKRLQREATVDFRPGDDGAINARDDAAGAALPRLLEEREMLLEALRDAAAEIDCGPTGDSQFAREAIRRAES